MMRQTVVDRPVTCNTCNNGAIVRFLPLQVDSVFSKKGRKAVYEGESHAFSELLYSLDMVRWKR